MATPRGAVHRDLEQRFRNIEAKLREVTTKSLTRRQLSVGSGDFLVSGGSLTVDGGDFLLLDTDGSTVFRLGPQFWGDRGVTIRRDDGTEVFSTSKEFSASDPQRWRLKDAIGNLVVAESVFDQGLERPYLAHPMQPIGPAGTAVTCGPWGLERVVNTTSFTDVFMWKGQRQNAWLMPVLNVRTGDATTSAEVRCVDDAGTVLDGFFQPAWTGSAATGSAADREVRPGYGLRLPGVYGDEVRVRVQARRVAGAGTVTVAVRSSTGWGS